MSDTLPLPEPVQIDKHLPTGVVIRGYTADQMRTYAAAAVEEMRERCAQVCDAVAVDDMTGYGIAADCANKIRATPCTTAPSDGQ